MATEPRAHVPHNALILVGDGQKALFLRNKGSPQRVRLVVERILERDNPPTREQGTDRPGRATASLGVARSAMQEADWHHIAKERVCQRACGSTLSSCARQPFRKTCHHRAAKNIGQSSQGVPRGSRRARGRRDSQGTDVASGWRDRAACRSLAHAVYFSSRLVVQAPCCESGSWRMSRLCHDRTGRHHGNLPQGAGTFPERINSNHVWSQRRTPPRQAWLHQAIIAGRICKNESERAMKRNVDIDIANPDETIPQAALSGCALVPGAKAC